MYLVFHSYLFYPGWLLLSTDKDQESNTNVFSTEDELPEVSILLAAYNEEKVIAEKIRKTFETNYPLNKIKVFIGSDASTDETNQIVRNFSDEFPQITLVEFPGRTGKSGIINQLAELASSEILILTDANVFFERDTIFQLVKHFANPDIKQVAANIIKVSPKSDGIAEQEKSYIRIENQIKLCESIRWNLILGAEGGCYAIRKVNFAPVPPKFFMDDFYITMHVLENKGKVIFEPKAICKEDVPTQSSEEFKRKIRISIGNFQNLNRYKKLLFPISSDLAFAFWSHKVLRWLTPFFIIIIFGASLYLSTVNGWFVILSLIQAGLLLSPILDAILGAAGIHIAILRYIGHFYLMNLALLKGFWIYITGVKSNVWTPTKRNT